MAEEAEGGCVAVAEAAGIICSLRAADLAGWTPPWKASPEEPTPREPETETAAWPAVSRGKRTRSSAANKGRRWARGSPASPLDYSGGSGASTSGGEDGAFCSPPATVASARAQSVATPTAAPASSSLAKVGSAGGGARRPLILPVPAPTPPARTAGPRSRKKMKLPEVQQLVLSLSAENDGLRKEMQSLRRACTALSKENGRLETRLEHSPSSSKRKRIVSEDEERVQGKAPQSGGGGFVLPDLNIPVDAQAAAP